MMSSNSLMSFIEPASGPLVEKSIHDGVGDRAIKPFVGLSPARPQNAAGILTDPPPSVAVAIGTSPATSAAPLPPLDPPGVHSGAHGLRVSPKSRFVVKPSKAHSGTFACPTTIAPA